MASRENYLRSVMLGRDVDMDSDSVNTREASLIRRRGYATAEAHHGRGASFLELEAGSTGWDGGDGGAGGNRREYLTVGQHMIRRAGKMAKLKDLLDEETYIARRRALNQRMKQNILSGGKTSGDAGTPAPGVGGGNNRRAPSASSGSISPGTMTSSSPNADTNTATPGAAAPSGSEELSATTTPTSTIPTDVSGGVEWSPGSRLPVETFEEPEKLTTGKKGGSLIKRSSRKPVKKVGETVDTVEAEKRWKTGDGRKDYANALRRARRAQELIWSSTAEDRRTPGFLGSSPQPISPPTPKVEGLKFTDDEARVILNARSKWLAVKKHPGTEEYQQAREEHRAATDFIRQKRSEATRRLNAQADVMERWFDSSAPRQNR